jgi:pimeloyl-ACP methyl ester carboxylesterase
MDTTEPASLLLLPGFDGTGELFTPLQSALGSRVSSTVVRYRDEVVLEDYVESVAALLPEQGAMLVAESFSGPVALTLISRYPQRIRRAVLCATFSTSPFRPLTRLARFVPELFFGPAPTQPVMLRTFCFDATTDEELMEKALAVIRSVPAATIKQRLNLLSELDIAPLLAGIETPVLYLQAMRDKVVGSHLTQQLVNGLPQVEVRQIDGPHLLLQCRPQECAEAILSFLGPETATTGASVP